MTSQILWSFYFIQVRSWSEPPVLQEHGEHAGADEEEDLDEEGEQKAGEQDGEYWGGERFAECFLLS